MGRETDILNEQKTPAIPDLRTDSSTEFGSLEEIPTHSGPSFLKLVLLGLIF